MIARLRLSSLCLAAMLAACARSPSSNLGEFLRPPYVSLERLRLQVTESQELEKAVLLRLSAADIAMRQHDNDRATKILAKVPLDQLKLAQQVFASVLAAELAINRNDPKTALVALNHPSVSRIGELPESLQVRTHTVHARALAAEGNTLAAARELAAISSLLKGDAVDNNNDAIWALVAALPVDQLQAQSDDVLGGWMSLAQAVKSKDALQDQKNAIDQWRAQNPNHPAFIQLPTQLLELRKLSSQPLTKIALLLPQDGPLASVSKALRDGFMAAHYQVQEAEKTSPSIQLYDSSRVTSLDEFYRKAQADGVQLVVGPLEKSLVKRLNARVQLPITTLALNHSEGVQGPAQLFQFGLAAEDEAREVARRARADGLIRAGAMVPKSKWGERVLNAFRQEWVTHGGSIIGIEYIEKPVNLAQQVGNLVRLRKSVGESIQFLFLAATPQQAQQIRPTLDYQYAGDLPVYATSHVFSASGNLDQYNDMNGIRFCEAPWLLEPGNPLRQQVEAQWPQAGSSLGRLYAMGIDAYTLSSRLWQLKALPGNRIDGFSGILGMSPMQHVERELPWAEFVNGRIQRLLDTSN